jgi:hypothetical protein
MLYVSHFSITRTLKFSSTLFASGFGLIYMTGGEKKRQNDYVHNNNVKLCDKNSTIP